MNSRHENFIKLAEERMTRIFQATNLISHLSTVSRYEYTKEEVNEIWNGFFEKGETVKQLFVMEDSYYTPFDEKWQFSFHTPAIGNSSKNANFRKLATQRMNNVYKNLLLISNLRNKKNYQYSQEEVDFLFSEYMEKGLEIKCFFEPYLQNLKNEFSFSNQFATNVIKTK